MDLGLEHHQIKEKIFFSLWNLLGVDLLSFVTVYQVLANKVGSAAASSELQATSVISSNIQTYKLCSAEFRYYAEWLVHGKFVFSCKVTVIGKHLFDVLPVIELLFWDFYNLMAFIFD